MSNKSDALAASPTTKDALQLEQGSHSRRKPSPSPLRYGQASKLGTNKHEEEDNDIASDTDGASSSDNHQPSNLIRRGTLSKSYDTAEERTVLRKLDRRLTLFLCLLYLLSFLDRSNIGNARVAGMQTSLGISDSQFDMTLVAFYITYITFEWMILMYRLVPPHVYIASCVFAWGLVACLQSTVTSFTQLLVLRAALGVTEAAFGPGVPFYMTFFYRREELAYRVGLQISAAPLATSFASSLAWVIVKLNENGPLESWRALFLFEGFPSIIAAVFAYYMIPDSPSRVRWLTPRERKVAVLRLRSETSIASVSDKINVLSSNNASGLSSKLNRTSLLATFFDPKAYLTSLMFLSVNVSFASLPVFLPTIINDMSFSPLTSQILAAPPYLVAFVFVLLVSRASDRISDSRGLCLMLCAALSCVSYAVIACTGLLAQNGVLHEGLSVWVRYAAVYGAAMGLFASVVLIITWTLNNQASVEGKGVGMVILNVVGQCGPLIGVRLFPETDEPFFVKGMGVCSAFMGFVVLLSAGLRVYLRRLNARLDVDRGKGVYEMVGMGNEGEAEVEGLVSGVRNDGGGGHNKVFRYML